VTAPGDTGRHWHRFRVWRRTAPARWAHTPLRRALLLAGLILCVSATRWTLDVGPFPYLVALVALWTWLAVIADAWNRQVADAAAAPTVPPEPLYTTILATPWQSDDVAPHVLAGWDRVSTAIADQARQLGLDVDDTYTLTVLDAAVIMAVTYAETHPVTPDAALRIHDAAWRSRIVERQRLGPTPSPDPQ
jgi:hypothetical protein